MGFSMVMIWLLRCLVDRIDDAGENGIDLPLPALPVMRTRPPVLLYRLMTVSECRGRYNRAAQRRPRAGRRRGKPRCLWRCSGSLAQTL